MPSPNAQGDIVLDATRIANIRLHHGFSAPSMNNLAEKLLLTVEEITEAFREDRNRQHLDEIRYSAEIGFWCKAHHRTVCGICPPWIPSRNPLDKEANADPHNWERYELSKPEGFPIEVADAIMRLTDICYSLQIDLQTALDIKMDYNTQRPTGHGRKF
jgi:hypothetical protein